ncbi:hypothetical protein [Brucella sp. 2280]|uniref:hypothetical protein n=1 Tax=Brucella sp. 2280 TaxID=2592625 RepID=UPI0012971710|nr:hypothetical protein [Brucella sp. 2280]QGA58133.1 hypothetical protein GHC20_13775 [Brucella sp. 2280]
MQPTDFPPSGTVLERVLSAIIAAHPSVQMNGSVRQRLDMAMTALLGPASTDERNMAEALLFMARKRRREIADMEMLAISGRPDLARRVSSVQHLAVSAAREILHCGEDDVAAIAASLRKLFCQRMEVGTAVPDLVSEALETEAVKRICDELSEWGIPTRSSGHD